MKNQPLQTKKIHRKQLLINVMSKPQKIIFLLLVNIWLITLITFWFWWIKNYKFINWIDICTNSVLLAWNTLLPCYYFYFVARMRRCNPNIPLATNWRVAMVVTKAPSEPWSIVKKTLVAMLAQQYPHDTWLADESPSEETINWCQSHGVSISTRQGIVEYHQSQWPRRTKCKEGNLAFFYDKFGYDNYDFVVQMDADHVPAEGYLSAMLRPFVDNRVGYVAAPSICDANASSSWVARARLFAEATMHGSLQAGYNDGWAPLCIGSHYAVRTIALKEIGGLGPELAEDHTTTLMMNAHGWRGVFALDAEAHGDGPACFTDLIVQEFQWSRSLMKVLLSVTPRYWHRLNLRLKFQFLFSQVWYPMFGITMLLNSLLPLMAVFNDSYWYKLYYWEFICRLFVLTFTCLIPIAWLKKCRCLRPDNAPVISWEILLLQFARWPWILLGICDAILNYMLNIDPQFKITPKGAKPSKSLSLKVLLPYILIALISQVFIVINNRFILSQISGLLALANSLIYMGLSVIIIWLEFAENHNQP